MRIAQISTLGTPVRRGSSGSIEGVVWQLTRELVKKGHEVTVFAAAGSRVDGELVATVPGTYGHNGAPGDWQTCEWINLCRAVEQSGRFDVMHSHSYLYGLTLQGLSRAPMIHTLHLNGDEEFARLWGLYPDARVTAISNYQWSLFPECRPTAVIHHGVDPAQFTLRKEPDDYLLFLGRFTPGKGVLQAIAVARQLGLRIKLAGPVNDYYRKHVEPVVDQRSVEYVGTVAGPARDQLMGGARALVYPVREPEPFGLVMVEAMMCGTPVAAVRIGAVGELVDEDITGCCASTAEGFPQAVLGAIGLDRLMVRRRAEARFSASRMASEYVRVYEGALSGRRGVTTAADMDPLGGAAEEDSGVVAGGCDG